ncbi:hypothetical protein [Psychrosphaera aestuarii]|uniref:hypothetical protein n=1 Tax=Psychrosphaera aestuarii TaxID=1266052 RepID=UPI001B31E9E0|nr:hypothetical protein [Psychrosphaera aestuarii]
MTSISLLDIASTSDDLAREIENRKVTREEHDSEQDISNPLNTKKSQPTNISNLDKDFTNKYPRFKKEISLFARVFRNTELLMDRERVVSTFDRILKSYLFSMKVDITRLDENILLPHIIPTIEKKFKEEGIDERDKIKILNSVRVLFSVIRASIPNVAEEMMSNDLATKKPRFKSFLIHKLDDDVTDAEQMLLRFLLLEIDRSDLSNNIKALLNCTDKLTRNTLFLKLVILREKRHDFTDQDKKLIGNALNKLINNNKKYLRTCSLGSIVSINLILVTYWTKINSLRSYYC